MLSLNEQNKRKLERKGSTPASGRMQFPVFTKSGASCFDGPTGNPYAYTEGKLPTAGSSLVTSSGDA